MKNKQWYAVYTKPKWEKKVSSGLSANLLENYCPLNKVIKQWSDRKKLIEEPLFTSYVFVNVSSKELTKVRQIDGVVNFVYWLGKPAVIKDQEIDAIKLFLNNYSSVKIEPLIINPLDKVKIMDGPLIDVEGEVIKVNGPSAKILITSLGLAVTADVKKESLAVLKNTARNNASVYSPYRL